MSRASKGTSPSSALLLPMPQPTLFASINASRVVFKVMDDAKAPRRMPMWQRALKARGQGSQAAQPFDRGRAHSWLGEAFDKFVNDASGAQLSVNIVTVFVSATPYNLQTCKSQIPIENEVDMLAQQQQLAVGLLWDGALCGTYSLLGAKEGMQRPPKPATSPTTLL